MIDYMPPAELAERFERFGLDADARVVAQTRQEFTLWLQRFFALDPVRCSDLVLATNEALANSAEFAYRLAEEPGTIDFLATYHPDERKMIVDICDQGTWRTRQTNSTPLHRGRGIPLMEALADRATIETSADGTLVRLEWNSVNRI
ncbi:MAG: ATP-binding protein [Mycobacterium sp.]|nr:ATP-binding protein [Mycobacterium sp.]